MNVSDQPTVAHVKEFLLQGIGAGLPSQLGRGPDGIVREVRERYPGADDGA